jgi:UDP-N-acetyl-D-galactosamine dehydrogenase
MEALDTIAIVGLGYVGLPLAVAFGRLRRTIGLDLNVEKLNFYRAGTDPSGEVEPKQLAQATMLEFCSDASKLSEAQIIIVVVPTPIDEARRPDLSPLEGACRSVGPHLQY